MRREVIADEKGHQDGGDGIDETGAQFEQMLHQRHARGFDFIPGRLVGHGVFPSRSEEHTSELQSLMRISYAVFCLKKKTRTTSTTKNTTEKNTRSNKNR